MIDGVNVNFNGKELKKGEQIKIKRILGIRRGQHTIKVNNFNGEWLVTIFLFIKLCVLTRLCSDNLSEIVYENICALLVSENQNKAILLVQKGD